MLRQLADRLRRTGLRHTLGLLAIAAYYVATNPRHWAIRRCRCCCRTSLFLPLHRGDEAIRCLRCGANRRMEMMAEVLRERTGGHLTRMHVLELDPDSCLVSVLIGARTYVRTFYSAMQPVGSVDRSGARCEDITGLTFVDESFDIIVSSDVLEHVPDLDAAFAETYRVLRPGGFHVFTVPVSERTARRAVRKGDEVVHLLPPHYHLDPRDPKGILAYWDLGPDLMQRFADSGLAFGIAAGPEGPDGRIVFTATRPANTVAATLDTGSIGRVDRGMGTWSGRGQ